MSDFLSFLVVSFVVIAVPGPDTAITVRNTLQGGRMGGVLTALGIAAGQTIWALTASAGLVALLVASGPLFAAIKYAGSAYLVYLGIRALREAIWPTGHYPAASLSVRRLTSRAAFAQGLVSNLGNPKMGVFFASLLPQFVPAGETQFGVLLSLGAIFAGMTLAWLVLYAVIIARADAFLRRPAVRRSIEAVTGIVLVALGLRIAAEQR